MSTDSAAPDIQFFAGPARNDGRRLLQAVNGDQELKRDVFNPNVERQRRRFATELARLLGQPDRIEQFVELLLAAADRADELCLQADEQNEAANNNRRGPSQASRLVALAESCELFHAPDGMGYATFSIDGHNETWSLKSNDFKRWLSHRYYNANGNITTSQAIQEALNALEGRAQFDGAEQHVYTRLAEHAGQYILDLGDPTWSVVVIDVDGWRVVHDSPVKFRRPGGMMALPSPITGGSLQELTRFVNVGEEHRPLLFGWLVAAVRPVGPYPVLSINGEQGTAKSTTSKVLRRLIDPNQTDLRAEPKDARDLFIAASNSWVLPFDNMSYVQPWLSDALCRLACGGGFATRKLYSDSEETLLAAQRPIVLNGIEELGTRSDLLDRSIMLTLQPIDARHRRTESAFWLDFANAHPRLLGALLDAVVIGLQNLPTTRLDNLPRMADCATWVTAAEPGLPIAPGEFLRRYEVNRQSAHELALEGSPLTAAVRSLMSRRPVWEGTATELLNLLNETQGASASARRFLGGIDTSTPRGWPANPQKLSAVLRRLAPNLRAIGLVVEIGRRHSRSITISQAIVQAVGQPAPSPLATQPIHLAPNSNGRAASGTH